MTAAGWQISAAARFSTNTIIWNNQDSSGVGTANATIYNDSSTPTINYSLAQGMNPSGTGNLDGTNLANDPDFVTAVDPSSAPSTSGDLHLQDGSPAIDQGDNAAVSGVTTDLDGNPRIHDGTVDLGAYEKLISPPPQPTTRLYVDKDASGAGTGGDWANALNSLQDALLIASLNSQIVEIWVAEGVYYPDQGVAQTNNNRNASFALRNGLALYGEFNGSETSLGQRNPWAHISVLSGDIDGNDTTDSHGVVNNVANIHGANSYHVLVAITVGTETVLDGFTVTAGDSADQAGGLYNYYSNPTLANSTFSAIRAVNGGGMFNFSSHPTLTNMVFIGNYAYYYGGGIYNNRHSRLYTWNVSFYTNYAGWYGGAIFNEGEFYMKAMPCYDNHAGVSGGGIYSTYGKLSRPAGAGSPTGLQRVLEDVSFRGNSAAGDGGAFYNQEGSPVLNNVAFSGNDAGGDGGGMYNTGGSPSLTSVTFSGNDADGGGGAMANVLSTISMAKTIIWGDRDNSGAGSAEFFDLQ